MQVFRNNHLRRKLTVFFFEVFFSNDSYNIKMINISLISNIFNKVVVAMKYTTKFFTVLVLHEKVERVMYKVSCHGGNEYRLQ